MVQVFDTRFKGRQGIIAATALESNDGLILFDVGPESTYHHLSKELSAAGFEPHEIRHIFLSHIHFDHAGAAWRFAEKGATIYVHPRGAPHLLDPSRLVESARRIFGEEMDELWGKIAPVPPEKLKVLQDNEVVQIDGYIIRALATPGHASHHHVYHWDGNLFGGDVAGVRLGSGPPIPPFVPPELDVEAWQQSIDRMRYLNAEKLYLPHFGAVEGSVTDHFEGLGERVERWSSWLRDRIRAGENERQLRASFAQYEKDDLLAAGISDEQVMDYEAADPSHMAVTASVRYWQRHDQR
jgi:glyoxylase-like metal-dependent hydrolase (beta-lactamase superfamily II)